MATDKDLFAATTEQIAAMSDTQLVEFFKPLILAEPAPVAQLTYTPSLETLEDEDCPIKPRKKAKTKHEKLRELAAKAAEITDDGLI